MKKVIALASALALLTSQIFVSIPRADAVANASQCLAPTAEYRIDSMQTVSGQLRVVMNYSSAMLSTSAWRDGKVKFYARKNRTVESPGYFWGGTENNFFAHVAPSSISGTQVTFNLPIPPASFTYYDSGGNYTVERAANLVALHENAIYPSGTWSVNNYYCDGYLIAKKIPASGSFSITGNSGQNYSIVVTDSATVESQATVQMTSGNSTIAVGGQSISPMGSITLNGLGAESVISFSADGANASFYRPERGENFGYQYPSVQSPVWEGTTLKVTMDENRSWANRCSSYCVAGIMPQMVRYYYADGTLSSWMGLGAPTTTTSGPAPMYSQINTYYLTPPSNVSTLYFGYSSSFQRGNPAQDFRIETYNQTLSYFTAGVPTFPDTTPPTWTTGYSPIINGGAASTGNLSVTFPAPKAEDNIGISKCEVSNNNNTWQRISCDHEISGADKSVTWSLANGISGPRTIYVRACDSANQCTPVLSDTITYNAPLFTYAEEVQGNLYHPSQPDLTYPTWPANYVFQINSGATTTSSSSVTVGSIATSNPEEVAYCQLSNDGQNWSDATCGTSNPWTLSAGSNTIKTVYARACNAQNRCAYIGDNIRLGSTTEGVPPVITHLTVMPSTTSLGTIPGYTSTPEVVLKAYINDVSPMGCDIDSGSGFGQDFTANGTGGCGNTGYKTFALPNVTPSTLADLLRNFTLRAWDNSSGEARVTASIIYDTENPTVNYSGYTGGLRTTSFTGDVTMSCDDNIGCRAIEYYVGTHFNSSPELCDDIGDQVVWQTCSVEDGSCTTNLTVGHNEGLCVRARDNAGRLAYSPRVSTQVDSEPPVFSAVAVSTEDGTTIPLQNSAYHTQSNSPVITFDLADANPSWETDTSSDGACEVLVDGSPVQGLCTYRAAGTPSSFRLVNPLAEGTHTLSFTVADVLDQPATLSVPVVVDVQNPTYSFGTGAGTIQVIAGEAARSLTVTLPSFEDVGDAGMRDVRISLSRQGSAESPFTLMQVLDATTNMSLEGNTLIIRPSTDSGAETFPDSVTIANLEKSSPEGVQYLYDLSLTAFDRAGNQVEERPDALLSRTDLAFDTLAPTIGTVTRPGMDTTRFGDGSSENPYRVGTIRSISTRIPITERTNNHTNTANPPLRVRQVEGRVNGDTLLPAGDIYATNSFLDLLGSITDGIMGGGDPSAAGSAGCDTLDGTRSCNALIDFSIPENFLGTVDFRVDDSAGNRSDASSFWVKQDSRRPLLLAGFNLTANIAPGEHYKGTLYRFTASNINPNGDDKELTAYVSYMQAGGAPTVRLASMTATGTENQFTFEVPLNNIAYGAQDLQIYFEDNYGNRHDGSAASLGDTLTYAVYHDNVAPDVANFRYSWTDDDATVSFDSVTEDSFPLTITTQTSTDGETWTNRGDVLTRANSGEAANTTFTITDVAPEEQIRVVFGDTVKDFQAGSVINGTNPRTDYVVRDILLTITEQGETLRVSYTPETGIDMNNFDSFTVSYTGPHGRTGSFDAVTTFTEGGALMGNITMPLMGTYTFNVSLTYNDGRPALQSTKTYEQTTDIVTPLATLELPLVPELVTFNEELGRYYVRTSTPELTFRYNIDPEFIGASTIYDDSLPLTLTITGAEDSVTTNITPTGTGTYTGTLDIELLQERLYNLTGTISDGAGRSVPFTFAVVKDPSIPMFTTTFTDPTSNEALSVLANVGENVFMTAADSTYLDILVTNEEEPVTFTYEVEGATITELGNIPDQPAGMRSLRLQLNGLVEGTPATVSVTVLDLAGSSRIASATVQRDSTAPLLTAGEVAFPDATSAVNPVPITAVFEDFSRIDYVVTVGETPLTRRPYNGHIRLPEGVSENISIVFMDELDNPTEPFVISNPLYVDSIDPSATFSFDPNSESTNEANIRVLLSDVIEAGPYLDWTVTNEGNVVGSGRILQEVYGSADPIAQIALNPNTTNTLVATLRDSLGNSLSSDTLTIVHDNEAPEVTFEEGVLGATLSWNFTVIEAGGSGIANVSARIRNVSNGMAVTSGSLTPVEGSYSFASAALPLNPGQRYQIIVGTSDSLGNEGSFSSTLVEIPDDSGGLDPTLTPIPLPDTLTGERLNVTVSNGTTINYVAVDMPRGENLYLQDVLELGTNTLTGEQLDKFPVGYYTITIEDELENSHIIENYLVTPYYTDPEGDIDGNGFGGGITDHKLVTIAEALGTIYVDAALMDRLNEIKSLIQNRIASEIRLFLQN